MLSLGSLERYSHGDSQEKKRKKNPSSYCRECAGQKTPILADILRFFSRIFSIIFLRILEF